MLVKIILQFLNQIKIPAISLSSMLSALIYWRKWLFNFFIGHSYIMFWSLFLLIPITIVLAAYICHFIHNSRKKSFAGILWIKAKPFCPMCKQELAIVKDPKKPIHSSDFYCKSCNINPKTFSENGLFMPAILAMQLRGDKGFKYSLQEEMKRLDEEAKRQQIHSKITSI